jgi:hypothetical protein
MRGIKPGCLSDPAQHAERGLYIGLQAKNDILEIVAPGKDAITS